MDAKRVQQATVLALALTLERLFEALDSDNRERALEQVLILEQGVTLLTSSLADEYNVAPEVLLALRKQLVEQIQGASGATEFAVVVDDAFIEQRNNAKLN